MEFFSNFKWAVPQAFSSAVALCRFEEGDVLYDTQEAYDGTWGEAVKYIGHFLQVRYPARATSSEKDQAGGVFEKNWYSEVRLELFKKTEKVGASQIITTQGRLYTALWKGDLSVLETDAEEPPLPVNARNVTKQLQDVQEMALRYSAGHPVFVMARDCSNQPSRDKFNKIYAKLKPNLYRKPEISSPEQAGHPNWQIVAPTVEIVFFTATGITSKELEIQIKDAVYVPSKNAKKDMFKLSAHGVIFDEDS